MPLRVLCDENVPHSVAASLATWGVSVTTVRSGASDQAVAAQAKRERRILLTFDTDFANILAYPPRHFFGIVRINIEPPYTETIEAALKHLFTTFTKTGDFRGKLIILEPTGYRVWEP